MSKFKSSLRFLFGDLDGFYFINFASKPPADLSKGKMFFSSLKRYVFGATPKYIDLDYIIVGGNYLLNLLAARALARTNKTCLVYQTTERDRWFYKIAENRDFRRIIDKKLNLISPDSLNGSEWVQYIIEKRLPFNASNLFFVEEDLFYVGSHLDKSIFFIDSDMFGVVKDDGLPNPFRAHFSKLRLIRYGLDKESLVGKIIDPIPVVRGFAHSKKVIRSNKVILTSMTHTIQERRSQNGEFYNFEYDDKNIYPFGSANLIPKNTDNFVGLILDDINRIEGLANT